MEGGCPSWPFGRAVRGFHRQVGSPTTSRRAAGGGSGVKSEGFQRDRYGRPTVVVRWKEHSTAKELVKTALRLDGLRDEMAANARFLTYISRLGMYAFVH